MAFKEDVMKYVEKGVSVSKEALTKAGSAVSKFSDESIIRIEKKQFETQYKKSLQELGKMVYECFDKNKEIKVDTNMETICNKIKELKKEIERRENKRKFLEKKIYKKRKKRVDKMNRKVLYSYSLTDESI